MPPTEGNGWGLARHVAERRDMSPAGRTRRANFDDSLKALRDLGFRESAIEFYRKAARTTGLLPHEVVRHLAEAIASSLTENMRTGLGSPRQRQA